MTSIYACVRIVTIYSYCIFFLIYTYVNGEPVTEFRYGFGLLHPHADINAWISYVQGSLVILNRLPVGDCFHRILDSYTYIHSLY
jgi:hypothetical protein